MAEKLLVHVRLLEEGSEAARGTQAMPIEAGVCRLLAPSNYDPEDEIWEFVPETVVRYKAVKDANGRDILLAYEKVE